MSLPESTYNTTDSILKYTAIQELRNQGIAFVDGQSRFLTKNIVDQSTAQNVPEGYHVIYIENAGDVTITVEYPETPELEFEIEAGGSVRLVSEAFNGQPEVNVIPGTTVGDEVNSISLTLQKFV